MTACACPNPLTCPSRGRAGRVPCPRRAQPAAARRRPRRPAAVPDARLSERDGLLLAAIRHDPRYEPTPDERLRLARMIRDGVRDPALHRFTAD